MWARVSRSLWRGQTSLARLLHTTPRASAIGFELTSEQQEFQRLAAKFTQEEIIPVAAEYDKTGEYPWGVVRKAWELGLMNVTVPPEYGGLGLQLLDEVIVAEETAYGCTGITTALATNMLAGAPVHVAANHDQKKRFLGRMTEEPLLAVLRIDSDGRERMSQPAVPSPPSWWRETALDLPRARRLSQQRAVNAWSKLYVSSAKAVRTFDQEWNMGQRASNTSALSFEDVVVPEENVLGEPGKAFYYAMGAFDKTRPAEPYYLGVKVSPGNHIQGDINEEIEGLYVPLVCSGASPADVAMGAVGLARRAMDEATKYALERYAFGKPIFQYQAVSQMLADMAIGIEASRLLVYRGAWEADQGRRNTYYASLAKALAADVANKSAADAVQIFGGAGFNSEYPVEKLMRDAKIFQIYEGTSQIQRVIISRFLADAMKSKM
ncbi:Medium-chain specific acyl-CoA dehydrogenase, mitochondrial [Geodia barretti]|uniref:Medium-chain specific acyl-CoA dehydrogenase, mitochondrial n=1 Tax=Geodia barretti TaxID=519541 RepID=A0AA35T5Q6_GEOBA|nr:Medium-chain specific acyl-CoA dehydrogenase, mitochondrial [Geodia barretti]